MPIKLKNNVSSTLASAISASDVGLTVAAGTGALFPALATGDYFYATLVSIGGTQEIVRVTARANDAMAIVRAQDGTTPQSFAAGSRIEMRINAAAIAGGSTTTTLQAFGAIGDGVADDTAAVLAAITTAKTLEWGDGIYRITAPISVTVGKVDWHGAGAVIFYDGPYARVAVQITCGLNADHRVVGLGFDANQKTHVAAAFVAATVSEPFAQWPSFYASQIIARNAYRASTTFTDGDGIMVAGGFAHAEIDNLRVYDCYMAVGAEVFGAQGIFGITFGSNGSRRCRNIRLSDYYIENVWSEDPTYFNDQDGVRVFQEESERTSSCFLLNGVVKNVANRAIKLHSGVNTLVDGLYRELSSSVVPQTGAFNNPDIDSQQCPSTVTNCRFHYDGAWHQTLVQNYTERPELYRYGGVVVSNITGRFVNVTGSAIIPVRMTAESSTSTTKHLGTISNIAIDGPVSYFLSVLVRGSPSSSNTNSVSLTNAVAEVTTGAVVALSGTARLRVTASNIHNVNAVTPVPLGENFATGDRELFVSGHYGFTNVGAITSIGGDSGVVSALSVTASTSLTGPDPDALRIGSTLVGFNVPTDVGNTTTDVVLLLQPLADMLSHISGTVQLYRGIATSAGGATLRLFVMKDAGSGDAAGYCLFDGTAQKTAQLITCTYSGVQRIGVRISGGSTSQVLAKAFFNGNYFGSQPLRFVPAASVTGITTFVQRSGLEPVSAVLQPMRLPVYTAAALPSAATFTRTRVFVSDANATTFASIVAGGGANLVPAYSDGTNWRIG